MYIKKYFKFVNVLFVSGFVLLGTVYGADYKIADIARVTIDGCPTERHNSEGVFKFLDSQGSSFTISSLEQRPNNILEITGEYINVGSNPMIFLLRSVLEAQPFQGDISLTHKYNLKEQTLEDFVKAVNGIHSPIIPPEQLFKFSYQGISEINLYLKRSVNLRIAAKNSSSQYLEQDKERHETKINIPFYFEGSDVATAINYPIHTFHHEEITEEENRYKGCYFVNEDGKVLKVISKTYCIETDGVGGFKEWKSKNGRTERDDNYHIPVMGDCVGLVPNDALSQINWLKGRYVTYGDKNTQPVSNALPNILYIESVQNGVYALCQEYRVKFMQFIEPCALGQAHFNDSAQDMTIIKPTSIKLFPKKHPKPVDIQGSLQQDKYYRVDMTFTDCINRQNFKPFNEGAYTDENSVELSFHNHYPLLLSYKDDSHFSFDRWSKNVAPLLDFNFQGRIFDREPNKKHDCIDLSQEEHVNGMKILIKWFSHSSPVFGEKPKPEFGKIIIDGQNGTVSGNLDTLAMKGYVFDTLSLENFDQANSDYLSKITTFLENNTVNKFEISMANSEPFIVKTENNHYKKFFIEYLDRRADHTYEFRLKELNIWNFQNDIYNTDEKRKKILNHINGITSVIFKIEDAGERWPLMSDGIIECMARSKETLEKINLNNTNFTKIQTNIVFQHIRTFENLTFFSWYNAGWRFHRPAWDELTPQCDKLARALCDLKKLKEIHVDLPLISITFLDPVNRTAIKALAGISGLNEITYYARPKDHWDPYFDIEQADMSKYMRAILKNSAGSVKFCYKDTFPEL